MWSYCYIVSYRDLWPFCINYSSHRAFDWQLAYKGYLYVVRSIQKSKMQPGVPMLPRLCLVESSREFLPEGVPHNHGDYNQRKLSIFLILTTSLKPALDLLLHIRLSVSDVACSEHATSHCNVFYIQGQASPCTKWRILACNTLCFTESEAWSSPVDCNFHPTNPISKLEIAEKVSTGLL